MCGIAGVVSMEGRPALSPEPVRRMLGAIAHRGPDDDGVWVEPGIVLGHRRLSILDLSPAGHQPMRHDDGHLLAYNGEIYNHLEIRRELAGRGYHSTGDTETLLHALARWDMEALHRLNGMFAFAWWNRKRRSLHLVRDRLGVKPLYYAVVDRKLVFCSEIKGLLASGLVPYGLEPQAIADFLALRFVPPPLTAVKGIYKLAPGHMLTLAKGKVEVKAWWRLPVAAMDQEAPPHAQERFEDLLTDAVRMRMLADVPVGVFLSGGLDSSAVAAVVARDRRGGEPVRTFSIGFDKGGYYDEQFYARLVAKRLGTSHHETVVGEAEFYESLRRVVGALDEPIMDLAALPLDMLSAAARSKVKVVLSGEGSDEVLGGQRLARRGGGLLTE